MKSRIETLLYLTTMSIAASGAVFLGWSNILSRIFAVPLLVLNCIMRILYKPQSKSTEITSNACNIWIVCALVNGDTMFLSLRVMNLILMLLIVGSALYLWECKNHYIYEIVIACVCFVLPMLSVPFKITFIGVGLRVIAHALVYYCMQCNKYQILTPIIISFCIAATPVIPLILGSIVFILITKNQQIEDAVIGNISILPNVVDDVEPDNTHHMDITHELKTNSFRNRSNSLSKLPIAHKIVFKK